MNEKKKWGKPTRPHRTCTILLFLATALLAACSGGSGSGNSAASGSSFNTLEFQANFGLASIGALTAFDNLATGAGITVGIIDTGIDVDNPEFSGRIAAASINVVTNDVSTLQDLAGHGTNVAGIIAAGRNSAGIHGVAFNSTILALRAENTGGLTFTEVDVAVALDRAVANGAQVVNMSFGADAIGTSVFLTSLQNAVDSGVILIAAAGNEGGESTTQVESPARLSNCSAIVICTLLGTTFNARGRMISVGSVDAANSLSSFSNPAGDTATAHLMAPGENIVTTNLLSAGGGTTSVNGTSFSTPHVTGAIALLLQRFPTLTSVQAVDLLLTTATDLGAAGTDTVFGRGLLNLQAAFQAQGLSGLAVSNLVDGPRVDLEKTALSLGPAFGDSLSNEGFLALAIILDSYDRPFRADLRNRVVSVLRESSVTSFLESPNHRVHFSSPDGVSLAVNFSAAKNIDYQSWGQGRNPYEAEQFESLDFVVRLGSQGEMRVGLNTSPAWQFAETPGVGIDRSFFFATELASAPQITMLGKGHGLSFGGEVDGQTTVSFGVLSSDGYGPTNAGSGTLAQMTLRRTLGSDTTLGLGISVLQEQDALFATVGAGAFDEPRDTQSGFLTLSGVRQLAPSVDLQLSYTEAWAHPSKVDTGLLRNWSDVRANAFAVAVTVQNVIGDGDRIGFLVARPLRVYHATANLTLPVSRDLDGFVQHDTRRIELSPSGHELDFQLAYQRQMSNTLTASSFATLVMNPGHRRSAEPFFEGGLRLKLRF